MDSSPEVLESSPANKDDNVSVTSSNNRSSYEATSKRTSKEIQITHASEPEGVHGHEAERDKSLDNGSPPDLREVGLSGHATPEIDVTSPPSETSNDYEKAMAQLQADHEASELQWQEELHGYVEKIDALQAKLKYLAKEAAESAKSAAASASPGSMEKKLLEKDEKIAALMEEGQKLSKAELDHRTTIKKLRQYVAENAKSQADAKKKHEKLENDLAATQNKVKLAEAAERRSTDKLSSVTKLEKDIEAITAERNAGDATIMDLKTQLARVTARADAAERRAQTESVETERRQVAELKDDLSNARIEKEINDEKLRREIRDLKDGIEREKERSRVLEIELRNEQTVLESKMEGLRSRAEEVSSSTTGDTQAKLLRQIETLQSQYSVASENWQGIESSLVSRLASVEAERDEISKREADLRRKSREAVCRAAFPSLLIIINY